MNKLLSSPAYQYIKHAEKVNKENGHENLGFLSLERGFMPLQNPLKNLPSPFDIWDSVAYNLPEHYKNQNLRSALNNMPVLDAGDEFLEDKYLLRASMLMSILAHAYVRNERNEDLNIPDSITKPWETITKRLNRPKPFLSYIDLIIYNWKFKNNTICDLTLDNLNLLTPTVNNNEEHVFYLTQTEIAFKTIDAIKLVTDIQNAIVQNDKNSVINGLIQFKEILTEVTERSFLKIDPNPRSKTYVDPVIWAKTVAPFAVPLKEGVQGPSGTSSPFFHLIDTFIERSKYETILGKEALFIREWYPVHWRNFLNAIEKVSLKDFIKKHNDSELNGAYESFVESYTGDKGFLGVHRRKVYGYLQMAFKVGRSVTIGGFSGLFKERTWEEVDDELEATRLERYHKRELKCPFASVITKKSNISNNTTNIELDVSNKGLSYRPGDRCTIVPKNTTEEVEEIISLLNLTGDEIINLNEKWKNYFLKYYNQKKKSASLRQILRSAKLGNVKRIADLCPHLNLFLKDLDTENFTLADLIKRLSIFSPNVSKMLLPHLLDFLNPEQERLYSISSGFNDQKIQLTIGNATTVTTNGQKFKGVCSHFLTSTETDEKTKIPIRVVRPLRFSLPNDLENKPVVLFAGGSGIAPFKGFWEELKNKNSLKQLTIYYSVKHINDLVFKEELENLFLKYEFNLNIIVTRDQLILDKEASIKNRKLIFKKLTFSRLESILLKRNNGEQIFNAISNKGYFYTCGKAGFALSVLNTFKKIIKQFGNYSSEESLEVFYSLFADNRYMQDVFTSPNCISYGEKNKYYLSDIIGKNNSENGYWFSVNDKVYDVTEFKEIHPGGDKIIIDNTGRDATHEYFRANHQRSNEIESLLSMYCIGVLEKTILPTRLNKEYKTWTESLHLCTEMLNTFNADFSFKKKQTTKNETSEEITPYKIAIAVENQNRFLSEYVKNLKSILNSLFKNHNYLKNTILLFEEIIDLINIYNDPQQFKINSLIDDWEKLSLQEENNRLILKLFRKLLHDGLKIFEAYNENLNLEHHIAMRYVFIQFKKDLNKMKENITVPVCKIA